VGAGGGSVGAAADSAAAEPHAAPSTPTRVALAPQGRLDDDRARRLAGLGFVWEPGAARWEARFSELRAFAAAHGHARVPKGWPPNPPLAAWVDALRARWRARDGERAGLSLSQEARLRAAGFEFEAHVAWAARVEQLRGVRARQGHLRGRLPNSGSFRGLNDWGAAQRAAHRAGRLPAERAAELRELGFVWDVEAAAWAAGLAELDAALAARGFAATWALLNLVGARGLAGRGRGRGRARGGGPAAGAPAGVLEVARVARWYAGVRRRAAAGRLSEERVAALAARGFDALAPVAGPRRAGEQ
jgi:hypothetical protein